MPASTLVLGDIGTLVEADVRVGADWGPYIVHLVDANDNPIDITGCTFIGEIRKTYKSPTVEANLSISVINAVGGVFSFTVGHSTTSNFKFGETTKDAQGGYVWYFAMKDSTGREFPLYYGPFNVVWGSKT